MSIETILGVIGYLLVAPAAMANDLIALTSLEWAVDWLVLIGFIVYCLVKFPNLEQYDYKSNLIILAGIGLLLTCFKPTIWCVTALAVSFMDGIFPTLIILVMAATDYRILILRDIRYKFWTSAIAFVGVSRAHNTNWNHLKYVVSTSNVALLTTLSLLVLPMPFDLLAKLYMIDQFLAGKLIGLDFKFSQLRERFFLILVAIESRFHRVTKALACYSDTVCCIGCGVFGKIERFFGRDVFIGRPGTCVYTLVESTPVQACRRIGKGSGELVFSFFTPFALALLQSLITLDWYVGYILVFSFQILVSILIPCIQNSNILPYCESGWRHLVSMAWLSGIRPYRPLANKMYGCIFFLIFLHQVIINHWFIFVLIFFCTLFDFSNCMGVDALVPREPPLLNFSTLYKMYLEYTSEKEDDKVELTLESTFEFLRNTPTYLWYPEIFGTCDFTCYMINLSENFDFLMLILFNVVLLASYFHLLKQFVNQIYLFFTLTIMSVLTWVLPIGFYLPAIAMCVFTYCLSWLYRGFRMIDIMSLFIIQTPFLMVNILFKYQLGYKTLSHYEALFIIFTCGGAIGMSVLAWVRHFNSAKFHVIIEKNETGRILSKKIVFPFLYEMLFGSLIGDVIGDVAAACNAMSSALIGQTEIINRYVSCMTVDGEPTKDLLYKMLTNAKRNGTIDLFIESLNNKECIPEATLISLKQGIDPSVFGVIETIVDGDYVPRGNGVVVRIGGNTYVLTNAHVVCRDDKLDEVFSACKDDEFEAMPDIYFRNIDGREKINIITWNAKSDTALCTTKKRKGLTIGHYTPGKTYIWVGIAPPLNDVTNVFMYPIKPGPYGMVVGPLSEKGDSGSAIIDSAGNIVALKYGTSAVVENSPTYTGFFIPLDAFKNIHMDYKHVKPTSLDVKKISILDFVDSKKMDILNYPEFLTKFCGFTDEIIDELKKSYKSNDKKTIADILHGLGLVNMDLGAILKKKTADLLQTKAKVFLEKKMLCENPEYKSVIDDIQIVEDQIKDLMLLKGDLDDIEIDTDLINAIKIKEQELALLKEKKQQLLEKDPKYLERRSKEKEINRVLGSLGQEKYRLAQKLKELEGKSSDEDIAEIKSQLRILNQAKDYLTKHIMEGKLALSDLIESEEVKSAIDSRMPSELKAIKYPINFKSSVDGKWHCVLSDNDHRILTKHPAFDESILDLCETYGFTRSQWRKKIQRSTVSEEWYTRLMKYVTQEQVEQSGLPFNVWCWVRKDQSVESCPLHINCHLCGLILCCDKKEHKGCSSVLVNRLDRHLSSCRMQVTEGLNYYINGYAYSIEGKHLLNSDGDKCDMSKDPKHECWLTPEQMEAGDKDVTKRRMHYSVFGGDSRVHIYIKKNCADKLIRKMKVSESEIKQNIEAIDSRLTKFEQLVMSKMQNSLTATIDKTNDETRKYVETEFTGFGDYVDRKFSETKVELKKIEERLSQKFDKQIETTINKIVDTITKQTDKINDLGRDLVKCEVRISELECREQLEWDDELPKPPRKQERSVERPIVQPTYADKVKETRVQESSNGFQLIVSNLNGRHDDLVGSCGCPRCQCGSDCNCCLCDGKACIWCNSGDHSTQECTFATDKTCPKCEKVLPNWFSDSIVIPKEGKHGLTSLCCIQPEVCVICSNSGHHPLSCPVLRHSSISKLMSEVNTNGFNPSISKSLCIPRGIKKRATASKIGKKQRVERNPKNF